MNNDILIFTIYIIAIFAAILIIKPERKKQTTQTRVTAPTNEYVTLMEIVDTTIQRVIKHKHNLDYKVKDVRIIYDFKEDLTEITQNIVSSFAPTFLKELEYYHSRKYIIKYITQHVEVFLIEYTKENKLNTK